MRCGVSSPASRKHCWSYIPAAKIASSQDGASLKLFILISNLTTVTAQLRNREQHANVIFTVLVGNFVTDSEHRNMPSFKISDFGLAQEVPSFQGKTYLNRMRGAGTVPWWLPVSLSIISRSASADCKIGTNTDP
jgi:hypothetical protein